MKIIVYPNEILRKKCEDVITITPEILGIINEMKNIVLSSELNAALAANQVGILKKIIVVATEDGPIAFLNPKIIEQSKEMVYAEEGCLSFPDIFFKVKRAKTVRVEAGNENGEKIVISLKEFPARIFQHEIDHLNGKLFIDYLGLLRRLKIKQKLKRAKK